MRIRVEISVSGYDGSDRLTEVLDALYEGQFGPSVEMGYTITKDFAGIAGAAQALQRLHERLELLERVELES